MASKKQVKQTSPNVDSCSGCQTLCGCHIGGLFLNSQTWVSIIVAAIVFWVFDMIWHGHLLMPRYLETAQMWRPEAEMQGMMHWCFIYHGLLALVFTVVWTLTNPKNYIEGVKNGIFVMAPLALGAIGAHLWQMVPVDIAQMWALGHVLSGALAGAALTGVGHYYCSRGSCKL